MAKRMLDIIGAVIGLIVFSPIIGVVSVLIKITDGNPILFRDVRVGLNGKKFFIYKFRSMVIEAESLGGPLTAGDDSRITKFGRVFRRYKIDEIPQLVNVLRGEMSLVGPRAQKQYFYQFYDEMEKNTVLSVLPGITDFASIRFHDEEQILSGSFDPIKLYAQTIAKEKIRLQMKYVANKSFLLDLKIIFHTIGLLFISRARLSSEWLQINGISREIEDSSGN